MSWGYFCGLYWRSILLWSDGAAFFFEHPQSIRLQIRKKRIIRLIFFMEQTSFLLLIRAECYHCCADILAVCGFVKRVIIHQHIPANITFTSCWPAIVELDKSQFIEFASRIISANCIITKSDCGVRVVIEVVCINI